MRQALAGLQEEGERIANERQRLEGAPDRVARGLAHRQAAQATLESARHRQAQSLAQQERSRSTEAQRTQLQIECRAANQAGLQAIDALEAQDRGEQQRQERLQQRIAQRAAQQRSRWQTLQDRRRACLGVLARAAAVRRAERRLPMAELVRQTRAARLTTSRQQLQDLNECLGTVRAAQQRLAATLREAGQAAIRAEDLGRRFGLTNAVPCAGTDLQGKCQLLGDAREARALVPGAQSVIARLAGEKASIELELVTLRARCQALAGAPQQLGQAERACERAQASGPAGAAGGAVGRDRSSARGSVRARSGTRRDWARAHGRWSTGGDARGAGGTPADPCHPAADRPPDRTAVAAAAHHA